MDKAREQQLGHEAGQEAIELTRVRSRQMLSKALQRIQQALDANSIKPFNHDGEIIEAGPYIDHNTRLKAADMVIQLCNVAPATRHEITGKDGGPIETKDTTTLEDLSDDAIVARLNELRAERRGAPAPRSSAKKKSKS